MEWHQQTDVLVVGGGFAGHCTAIEAARAGADVLLLEKMPEAGGSTVLSAGFLAFAGTDLQAAEGLEDSTELLGNDLRAAGKGECDEALLQIYLDRQMETFHWLRENGVVFRSVHLSSGHSVPRAHMTDPVELIAVMARVAAATGRVATVFEAGAEELIRDPETGDVTGLVATVGGERQNIRARRAVVLASGGFTRSEELLHLFVPHQSNAMRYGGKGNSGDGLRMAWALGAGLRHTAYVKGTFGLHPHAATHDGRDWTKLAVYRGGIAVNKSAQRYVDESYSYKLLGDAVIQQEDGIAYQIFDQGIYDQASPGVAPFDFPEAKRRGLLLEADTLEDLAGKVGLDPSALKATVERYNGFVDKGCDEDFGRDGLSNHYGDLVRIERPPFYAYPSRSAIIATYCGLTVDTETRVIDVFGRPIGRLFATGELMGGFHGVAYMTGSSLGKCAIFGRITGREAAALAGAEPRPVEMAG